MALKQLDASAAQRSKVTDGSYALRTTQITYITHDEEKNKSSSDQADIQEHHQKSEHSRNTGAEKTANDAFRSPASHAAPLQGTSCAFRTLLVLRRSSSILRSSAIHGLCRFFLHSSLVLLFRSRLRIALGSYFGLLRLFLSLILLTFLSHNENV